MAGTTLLIHQPEIDASELAQTLFGGLPSVLAEGFTWPFCRTCNGTMQFLGQLRTTYRDSEERLLLVFMCQNEPGMCEEWDAEAGGNAVVPVSLSPLVMATTPASGNTTRNTRYGATLFVSANESYEEARKAWVESSVPDRSTLFGKLRSVFSHLPPEIRSRRQVLGQLRGEAEWIQNEEVPTCSNCGKEMRFVAQLEEGPDHKTAMNFGDAGCGYVFECEQCPSVARFLWQCS